MTPSFSRLFRPLTLCRILELVCMKVKLFLFPPDPPEPPGSVLFILYVFLRFTLPAAAKHGAIWVTDMFRKLRCHWNWRKMISASWLVDKKFTVTYFWEKLLLCPFFNIWSQKKFFAGSSTYSETDNQKPPCCSHDSATTFIHPVKTENVYLFPAAFYAFLSLAQWHLGTESKWFGIGF